MQVKEEAGRDAVGEMRRRGGRLMVNKHMDQVE